MRRAATLALAISAAAACQSLTYQNAYLEGVQAELIRQAQLWEGQQLASYGYEFSRECACTVDLLRPVHVDVTDGMLTGLTYTDSSTAVPMEKYESYFTVEQLFAQIQIAIDLRSDSVSVVYDAALHYPTSIRIDQDFRGVADELVLNATELVQKP